MLAVYTNNFRPLFSNFKKSLGNCKDIELIECLISFSKKYKKFEFQENSWYDAIELQLFNIIKFIKNETKEGEYFIISDVDVHFFQPEKIIELVKHDKDIIGMNEYGKMNSGFIIAKHNSDIIDMYEYIYEQVKSKKEGLADQDEINKYLKKNKINWGFIDARKALLGKQDIVLKSTVVFHATWTKTLEEKMSLINEVVEAYKKL